MKRAITFLTIILGLNFAQISANNVKIDSVSLVDATTLRMKISWDNSWFTVVPPANHDAVWIFCKRGYCPNPAIWSHAPVSTTLADHYAASPLQVYLDGKNNAGLFVRRSSAGYGNINSVEVRIRLTAPTPPGEYNYQVFAIEMVNIPQGAFYVGDGNSSSSIDKFIAGGTTNLPFQVTSDGQILVGNTSGSLYATGKIPPGTIPANYPAGYNSFYCMKYEVTAHQIATFFNHNSADVHTRWVGTMPSSEATYGQAFTSTTWQNVSFQYPWRAIWIINGCCCDVKGVGLSLAYLDWAGLRPMSELEFEKICRGPDYPVTNEYAWGTNNVYSFNTGSAYSQSYGTASETHNYPLGATQGIAVLSGMRVYRVGFAAKPGTSRYKSGGSYWGVMEMTGNVNEGCVSTATSSALTFTDQPGDGVLSIDGYVNQSTWPAYVACFNNGYFGKGYEFYSDGAHGFVSSRNSLQGGGGTNYMTIHFRGVR